MGFALFGLAVKYLPIFHAETEPQLEVPGPIHVGSGVLSHAGD